MGLHQGSRGSRDDEPVEIDLPGVDAKLSPAHKKVVEALKAYHKVKLENKIARAAMKQNEDAVTINALRALDELKLETGTLGEATFTIQLKRKLSVAIAERKAKSKGEGK